MLLSICIAGKNDEKDGFYLTRLSRSLRSWQQMIAGINAGIWFGHLDHPQAKHEINPHGVVKPFRANENMSWGTW